MIHRFPSAASDRASVLPSGPIGVWSATSKIRPARSPSPAPAASSIEASAAEKLWRSSRSAT